MYDLYQYQLNNRDGRWKKLERTVYDCYELWDGDKPIDACIGLIPDRWFNYDYRFVPGDPPEKRFT